MTNQLITYRLPIDYSLISLMSSLSYVWSVVSEVLNVLTGRMSVATKLCSNAKLFYYKKNHDFEGKKGYINYFFYRSLSKFPLKGKWNFAY